MKLPHLAEPLKKHTTMPRGVDHQTKVHYKGKDDDYIVFADSAEAVQEWKKDSSVPLAQVVSGWKVFITHKYVITAFFPPAYVAC